MSEVPLYHTAQIIVLLEALADSQELAQLTKDVRTGPGKGPPRGTTGFQVRNQLDFIRVLIKDCPNAVGPVTGAGNPTAAAKLLLDARREIYQSSLYEGYSKVRTHTARRKFLSDLP